MVLTCYSLEHIRIDLFLPEHPPSVLQYISLESFKRLLYIPETFFKKKKKKKKKQGGRWKWNFVSRGRRKTNQRCTPWLCQLGKQFVLESKFDRFFFLNIQSYSFNELVYF